MRRVLSLAIILPLLAGCGRTGITDEATELTVFAASSLTAAFTEKIGPAFEAEHDGTTVTFNFAASDALAAQIQSEGTADVFASASGTVDGRRRRGPRRERSRRTSRRTAS